MALARSSDPATSHAAAGAIEEHGTGRRQREICLEEVERFPGQTAAEIARNTGLERHVPSRRLPELRDNGFVENGPSKICAITARTQHHVAPGARSA